MPAPEQIFARIMKSRRLTGAAAKDFIEPSLESLHDPLLLPDIKIAVKRLRQAVKSQENVVIYGDYDIDGLCAATILSRALAHFGLDTEAFIPDRFEDGYGLGKQALGRLIKQGASLVITVDCGTTAVEEIKWAAKQGLDIIVTDHHQPGKTLPKAAVAVINPKRSDSKYPFAELAGAGVAFKLVQALQASWPGLKAGSERWLLDLVAFATVCDVVPLLGENRTLAYYGLKLWPNTRWPGLKALSQTTGVRGSDVTATTLGFVFGPRLNAAGRVEHARLALDLLMANKLEPALLIAQKLEMLNQQRRTEQEKIEMAVINRLNDTADRPVVVLADADWSHGVVGIVASRVMERTAKPTFLLQVLEDETVKGSARSYGDFKVADALHSASHLLIKGGGHAAAGGLSLKAVKLEEFSQFIYAYYEGLKLGDQTHLLKPQADVELSDLSGLDLVLVRLIGQLEPFGHGHREPLLEIKPLLVLTSRAIGSKKQHCRLHLADYQGNAVEAVMFNPVEHPVAGSEIKVTAKLRENDFGGRRRAELLIEDWQPISTVATPPLM